MNKKILIILTLAMVIIGAVTAVYAKENYYTSNFGFRGTMMNQSNIQNNRSYNNMIDLMRNNGFGGAANAIENRDYNAMNNFMNNLSDEQYNQMINIMKNNGYESMANMMGAVNRQQMTNIHNSMMGR